MLGAFIAATGIVSKDSVMKAVAHTFGEHKANLIAINERAFDEGVKLITGN
jgi:Pyruvate/2-oxoacid:ferredoxin oxidoreductase gamma subunit